MSACQYCGFEITLGKHVIINERDAHSECAVLAGDLEEDQLDNEEVQ